LSFTPITAVETLLVGADSVWELEPWELQAFVRRSSDESSEDQIVIYETAPGGAGYVEDLARRLPEVGEGAQRHLYGHTCYGACYLCLKQYANQRGILSIVDGRQKVKSGIGYQFCFIPSNRNRVYSCQKEKKKRPRVQQIRWSNCLFFGIFSSIIGRS
jgi:hypothetical protein